MIVPSGFGHRHFYNELGIIIPIAAGIMILIIVGVGIILYMRKKKEMYPPNKYGGKLMKSYL